jgi:hypothetical protein
VWQAGILKIKNQEIIARIPELLQNPDEYFRTYAKDMLDDLATKEDGGFEESVKYYLSAKLRRELGADFRIYSGNKPKEQPLRDILKSAHKPDLLLWSNDDAHLFIIELKSVVRPEFQYSFLFSKDGTQKNYEAGNGDFSHQQQRLVAARVLKGTKTRCFLLLLYLEQQAERNPQSGGWARSVFAEKSKGPQPELTVLIDAVIDIQHQTQMKFRFIEENMP